MTGELIIFENHQVRAIEQDGEVWLPLIDLADAWGYDRTSLPKNLERNKTVYDGCSRTMDILSHDGTKTESQECINEIGLYFLLARVSTGKMKNPGVREAIARFRKSVPELIQKYRKKEIVPVQAPDIVAELEAVKKYAKACECDFHILQAAIFEKHGEKELAKKISNIPDLVHGEPGVWLNPTEIGRECGGLSAQDINRYLYNQDFQYPQGSLWRLTAKGEQYGEEYLFESTSKHQEVRIRWHRSVLLASKLQKVPDQLALPGRAMS